MKFALGIETSCDDTSVALVREDGYVECVVTASQDELHSPFGGIVPEIASRNHTHNLIPLIDQIKNQTKFNWNELAGIAVTNRPGLLGSLMVGVVTAKTLSMALGVPFVGVHHLEGHICAPFLKDKIYQPPEFWKSPFLALVVSGGHTAIYKVETFGKYKMLGQTIDDAAGEAFDKFAKLLGFAYPGGPLIEKGAAGGNASKYSFPRGMIKEDNFDFSFSGLKTAAQILLKKMSTDEIAESKSDLCASYQKAITDVLCTKMQNASAQHKIKKMVITGGVSANSALKNAMTEWANKNNAEVLIPPSRYCTDNAAMIALAGIKRLMNSEYSNLDLGAYARSELAEV